MVSRNALSSCRSQRTEAEAIRDAVPVASGRFDSRMHGESIPPYVPPYAISNKPVHIPKSGPLDRAGRRSVYIKVRRNFYTPFLKTFDFPNPGSSVGKRDVTIAASQSLAMLNSKFIHQQAIS